MPQRAGILLRLWPRTIWDGGTGSRDGLGTCRPTTWGYAADAPAAGEKSDRLGSPIECCTKGTKGDLLPVQPAESPSRRVLGVLRSHERSDPF